jgi:hypothetical protein
MVTASKESVMNKREAMATKEPLLDPARPSEAAAFLLAGRLKGLRFSQDEWVVPSPDKYGWVVRSALWVERRVYTELTDAWKLCRGEIVLYAPKKADIRAVVFSMQMQTE